jgi:protein-tyrosine phosphatase
MMRRLASTIRHLPDQLAHPLRRARVKRALAMSQRLHNVLFICHGNICRSPYAAGAFESALPVALHNQTRTLSAGFIGPGRPAPSEAQSVAKRRGVDLSAHRSMLITEDLVSSADLIIVMEPAQRRGLLRQGWSADSVVVLGDLDPLPIQKRAIRDPFGQSERVFEDSYERIDRCLAALLAALNVPATRRGAGGNPDRYRAQVDQRSAEQVEELRQQR